MTDDSTTVYGSTPFISGEMPYAYSSVYITAAPRSSLSDASRAESAMAGGCHDDIPSLASAFEQYPS
ncbi:hypothetical protein ME763_37380 (plasmid) [Streptomyces murinus]|uniref:hypothetical protein n=1 Tax=Streptomyces murinus TaxID=33900 RepID=UPI001552277D|nr:hypothetical protein [Streptomyces murinus]WDO11383.1 hypothetical protein ME763_37380 [Streptomyces murinus]